MVEVGAVHQLRRLLLHRLENVVIPVPEGVDRQAADEIEVAIAIQVEEIDPVSPLEDKVRSPVGLQDVFRFLFEN